MTLHFMRVQPPDALNITLDVDEGLAAAMNQWRLAQPSPIPSPQEAIYELLRRALASEGYGSTGISASEDDVQIQAMVRAFQSACRAP
ncbi:MAG: hypothetical protein JWP99_262 [Devosia sp.]|nr:hypothetical protein [Devosia sp.]